MWLASSSGSTTPQARLAITDTQSAEHPLPFRIEPPTRHGRGQLVTALVMARRAACDARAGSHAAGAARDDNWSRQR